MLEYWFQKKNMVPSGTFWFRKLESEWVKVQSEKISASHLSSQPVMMTGWLVSGIVYAADYEQIYMDESW